MNWLLNLSTRGKLLFGFGVMLALLMAVSTMAYRDAERVKTSQHVLFRDDMATAYDLMSMRNAINRERVALLSLALTEAAHQPELLQQLGAEVREVEAVTVRLAGHRERDPELTRQIERLLAERNEFDAIRDREVLPLIRAGKRSEAASLITGRMQEKFASLREIADRIGERQLAQAENRMQMSERLVEEAQLTLGIFNVVAIAIGLLMVFLLGRMIATPLVQATELAKRIAGGDLSVSVPQSGSRDETGQLLQALDAMVNAWKQMLKETNGGIATLSAAAGEILASTAQIASGASETAAAVSETTATVEEVKQTAVLSSQKARAVSDAAQKANQSAEGGRRAVEEGIAAMEDIQQQMESIADTIVRLSERSQAIAEITATVSGLAEQSNLLAVNAAIEAAKAGEHGKGFAVVAQEVKDLAEQSRQATRQVRQILGEIQKAISAAVMTTEQGSRTVARGVGQTTEAGNTIKVLAESIADAALAAAQIAASSQQQLAGMDQVALAMENIKQVSNENAAGSRQSQSSAQNLHELAQKLRQLSERFTL